MGQELPNVVADRPITGECPLRPAVPDLLGELGVVLLEQLQQGFLLDADTEIGVFELGGGNIPVRLHQFLVAAVYLHSDFIHREVDSLRFDALARSTVVFTSHNRRGTSILQLNCLISPSTVRRHIKGRLPFGFSLPFFT